MPGSKTAYLSKALLDHSLGRTIFVPPAILHAAISTAPFDPEVTGAAFSEVATASYERVAFANDNTMWPGASLAAPAVKANLLDIIWAQAGESWGTPLSVYLADAADGGNLLYGTDVNSADEIVSGATFKVLAGTFIFTED